MILEVCISKKLRDFTLQAEFVLNEGTLGLMGSSGSGKSMLLKCLAGIETPDTGRIVLNSKVLFDSQQKINLIPQKRSIGYLFQSYALFPNMSVLENILCGMQIQNLAKKEAVKQAELLLDKFKLRDLAASYPRQLSGGQKQRTALARLLASKPQVILLDEPFSALDTDLKEELHLELAKVLTEYGKIAVLVSHDRQEVMKLSEKMFVIKQGVLQKDG